MDYEERKKEILEELEGMKEDAKLLIANAEKAIEKLEKSTTVEEYKEFDELSEELFGKPFKYISIM